MGLEFLSWVPAAGGPLVGAAVVALALGRWIDRVVGFVVGEAIALGGLVGAYFLGAVGSGSVLVAAMTVATVTSLVVVHRIDRPDGRWSATLQSRFVLGVPWGTLVVAALVLSVYLFVQGGFARWYDPVTIPFRAWSYLYPTGLFAAPFSHGGPGHLVGNLVGTLVLGSLAEFAWGQFPRERGASSFGSWRHNPLFRAFVVFPAVVIGTGLLTSVFSIGPVIGFSGVVFAFAGFAITRYPIGTVIAVVGADAVRTLYFALQDPVVTATARPTPPSAPWWAEVAIQGHALGLLIGIVLGWYVFVRRSGVSSSLRIWTGVLLFGMEQTLWAVYWFRGNETYVLYRGLGIVLVALLALLVTVSLTASNRSLLSGLVRRSAQSPAPVQPDGAGPGDTGPPGEPDRSDDGDDPRDWLTRRHLAIGLLFAGLLLLAIPGAGTNLFMASTYDAPEDGVTVRDYTVFYAEDVTNEMVAIVDVSFFNQTTQVRTSGVIVTNPDRHIWRQAVSKGRLAFLGSTSVDVGGVGWRESVTAVRRGWSTTSGNTVYKVWLGPPGGQQRLVFRSDPASAEAVVVGRNVSIAPGNERFLVSVARNNTTVGTAPIPAAGNVTRAGGLRFVNRDGSLYAAYNRTIVKVGQKETYDHGR
jgi:membrane associated rhomboid family serine protease